MQSKNSLGQMLELLRDLDEDMLPEEFDPAALIGDVRDKVDGIRWKINDWKYKAKMIEEEYIHPLQAKIRAIHGKRKRLEAYVLHEMTRLGVEKIPGSMFRVQLQDSPPSLEIKAAADEMMHMNYPGLVEMEEIYLWNKDELIDRMKAGESFTFAELKRGKHIRFYALGGEK